MKNILYLLIFSLLITNIISKAQNVSGFVYSIDSLGEKKAIPGAGVYFKANGKATTTDTNGQFSIKYDPKDSLYLMITHVGFVHDSMLIVDKALNTNLEFLLKEDKVQLKEISITGNQSGTTLSRLNILKTEQISKTGLKKMACCNLSESFENSATITVGFADAVSGAKQVQLLGLSGMYSQVLAENIPTLRGLSSTYGWGYIPSSWLESIQISKGASSVVNGYESVTGQINLEFKKPDKTEDLFLELYTDEYFRYEANITGARKITENLWTNLLVNASTQTGINYKTNSTIHDRNNDHFMDMPLTKLVNVFNRWLYVSPSGRLESRTGIRFLYEDRLGGQSSKCHKADVYYITDIGNRNFNVYNKTGITVGQKPGQSIGIINSYTSHELDSYFGSDKTYKLYNGTQNSLYSNIIFNSYLGNTNHQYTTGLSFLYDNFNTLFRDKLPANNTPLTPLNRLEVIPGAFGQYTYSYLEKFTFILGLREDYNTHYGWLFAPRTNIKYSVTKNIILRASAGLGYRAPNIIADNIGLMASTRKFDIDAINGLQIEKAWNFGGNATFYLPIWNNEKLMLSIEYFHTDFTKQAIIDLDRDSNDVYFYNLKGKSYANVWQTDISFPVFRGFDVFTAFRYNLNQITLTDGNQSYLVEKPLISRYRGLVNLSYASKFRKWVFDFTAQLNGPSRIPSASGYTTKATRSPAFPLYFTQVTKNTKRLDIYLGAENILDYRQKNPIINASNPFVKGFDASEIWGPLMGRKIYAGIRLRLGKLY